MAVENVTLKMCGNSFKEDRALLNPTIEILSGYQESFNACLHVGGKRFANDEVPKVKPELSISSAETGSLTVQTLVDIAIPLAPVLPDMITYCWELYKHANELIKIAVEHFAKTGNAMNVTIDNSPDAIVLNNNGNGNIVVSPDIYEVAKLAHKPLNKIAKQVISGNANRIAIQHNEDVADSIEINEDNKNSFYVRSKQIVEPGLIQIRCGIYQFNKKTGNGRLDILEEDEPPRSIRFEVHDEGYADYAAGLGAIYSVVSATKEMQVNALGESTIQRLHLHGIENFFGQI